MIPYTVTAARRLVLAQLNARLAGLPPATHAEVMPLLESIFGHVAGPISATVLVETILGAAHGGWTAILQALSANVSTIVESRVEAFFVNMLLVYLIHAQAAKPA